MSKCNYYREAENETYTPSCGVAFGEVCIDVHPEEAMEWVYCPFCGGKIKRRERKQHPDIVRGEDW